MRALLAISGSALALLLGGCDAGSPAYDACTDCNVVLISVDTLRADHVGSHGYDRPTTPEIDALAQRGVLFENAISQSSWTRPAHMSIFTGLHPREHGFIALADTRRLDDSIATLATVLRNHGYRTAAFTGGVNMAASYGFDQGFDVYRTNGKNFRDNLEDMRYWLDQQAPGPQVAPGAPTEPHAPGRNDAKAGKDAPRGSGKFFLFAHGYDPHTPYLTDPIDRQVLALPPSPPSQSLGETCRADGPVSRIVPFVDEYDGAVHRADRYVGKILRDLQSRGLLERTIVILLSDHGEEFLEHGRCFHIATLHREVLHVPLVVVAPSLAPRRVSEVVSASVTVAPTVMEMLGLDDHPFPGPSLLHVATGGPAPSDPVVSETERNAEKKGDGHVRALTTSDAKLVHWTSKSRYALYDTKTDVAESREVDDAKRVKLLADELERWAVAHPARTQSRRRGDGAADGKGGLKGGVKAGVGDGVKAGTQRGDKVGAQDDQQPEDPEAELEKRQREEELRSLGYAE